MDINTSLLTYVWTALTTDATLVSLMGSDFKVYENWAAPDATFPYMVYRLRLLPDMTSNVEYALLHLDIWDDSTTSTKVKAIRAQVMVLLDGKMFNATDFSNVLIRRTQPDEPVVEIEEYIQHHTTTFDLRFFKYT